MKAERRRTPVTMSLLMLFLFITVASVVIAVLYYRYQKKNILREKQLELSSISYLKIRQISQWRIDEINYGRYLAENNLLLKNYSAFLKRPSDPVIKSTLLQNLKSLTENFDYKNALFVSRNGNVLLSYPEMDSLVGEHLRPLLPGIIDRKNVVLTDLHKSSNVNFVHLDLVIPVKDPDRSDSVMLGALTLRVDPTVELYPTVESWPIVSKSAESSLFRNNGSEIEYLTWLRHSDSHEIFEKRPVSLTRLPEVMAIQGANSAIDAVDYSDVHVIAAMNKIPGTSWYLVAKVDRDEVLMSFAEQIRLVIIILILIIATSASILGILIRNQRVSYYREKYENELERLALVKHFDYILKYANDIIFLTDSNLNIVEVNDRVLEFYQYTREEIIGMNVRDIRSPEALLKLDSNISEIDAHEAATFETVHRRKDGSDFPLELSTRIVMIEGSKFYQTIGRDITERKKSEKTLVESEARFRKIFEESPFPIVMTSKEMYIIRANPAFCRMLGYSEDELKPITFRDFTHPDDVSDDEIGILRLVKGEIPVYRRVKRYLKKNGTIVWGSLTTAIVRDNDAEVQFFLAIIEDITAQKKASEELAQSFSLIKATLESTEDGILVVDNDGNIVQYNEKFLDLWRIAPNTMSLSSDRELLSYVRNQVVSPDGFISKVKEYYADAEAIGSDQISFIDGRIYERYSQPQKIDGKSVGRVWSFRDITVRKNAEKELIASKERAEESDRLKTAFLHNVSHEIRTPMNAIIGFSSLLNDNELTAEERQQYTEIIFQSGNQLLSIINDIVDIANVESGQARFNPSVFNLNVVLRSLLEQFNLPVNNARLGLSLELDLDDETAIIQTDSTKLIQVVSNLINNAIKFTKEGGICFGYHIKNDMIEFFVRDTGIGIPKEYHSKIFNRFFQVDNSVSRQFNGTGLGLSICKGYVELMGGLIDVESEPGQGTRFVFTVPFIRG